METLTASIIEFLKGQSIQLAIVFTAVLILTWLLQNKSAHVRYLLWLLVAIKCLTPPLVIFSVPVLPAMTVSTVVPEPRLSIVNDQPVTIVSTQHDNIDTITTATKTPPQPLINNQQSTINNLSTPRHPLNSTGVLLSLWAAGAACYLLWALGKAVRLGMQLKQIRRPLPPKLMIDQIEMLTQLWNYPGGFKVWLVNGINQPFVWGLWRGAIYLPTRFQSIQGDKQKAIVLHEMAHVVRFDAFVNLIQILIQGVFWFHPLVWLANRAIRQEREKCCDEIAVARLGTAPKEYGSAIVDTLLQEAQAGLTIPTLAVAGPVKNIEDRIKTIMQPGRRFFHRPSTIALLIVGMLAMIIIPTTIALTQKVTPPDYVLSGAVVDAQTEKPIAGAIVFDDGYGPQPYQKGITDDSGKFEYKSWNEEHNIAAKADGYKQEMMVFTTAPLDNSKNLNFKLQKDSAPENAKINIVLRTISIPNNEAQIQSLFDKAEINVPKFEMFVSQDNPDKKASGGVSYGHTFLTAQDVGNLLKAVQSSPDAKLLTSPRLKINSGESGTIVVQAKQAAPGEQFILYVAPSLTTDGILSQFTLISTDSMDSDKTQTIQTTHIRSKIVIPQDKTLLILGPDYYQESMGMQPASPKPKGRMLILMEAREESGTAVKIKTQDPGVSSKSAATLEFRVVPEAGKELGENDLKKYQDILETQGLGGNCDGYKWIAVNTQDKMSSYNTLPNYRYKDTVYILLCDQPDKRMLADGTWGLQKVSVDADSLNNPTILTEFDDSGSSRFGQLTKQNIGRQIAIIIDGKFFSAPRVQSIVSKQAAITGNFTNQEVGNLVQALIQGMPPLGVKHKESEKTDVKIESQTAVKNDRLDAMNQIRQAALACILFAGDQVGPLPNELGQLKPYLVENNSIPLDKIELLQAGRKLSEIKNVATTALLRMQLNDGKDGAIVAYCDGHVEYFSPERMKTQDYPDVSPRSGQKTEMKIETIKQNPQFASTPQNENRPRDRTLYFKLPLAQPRFHWKFTNKDLYLSGKLVLRIIRDKQINEIVVFNKGEITKGWEAIRSESGPQDNAIYFGFCSTAKYSTTPSDKIELELIAKEDLDGIGRLQTGVLKAGTHKAEGKLEIFHSDGNEAFIEWQDKWLLDITSEKGWMTSKQGLFINDKGTLRPLTRAEKKRICAGAHWSNREFFGRSDISLTENIETKNDNENHFRKIRIQKGVIKTHIDITEFADKRQEQVQSKISLVSEMDSNSYFTQRFDHSSKKVFLEDGSLNGDYSIFEFGRIDPKIAITIDILCYLFDDDNQVEPLKNATVFNDTADVDQFQLINLKDNSILYTLELNKMDWGLCRKIQWYNKSSNTLSKSIEYANFNRPVEFKTSADPGDSGYLLPYKTVRRYFDDKGNEERTETLNIVDAAMVSNEKRYDYNILQQNYGYDFDIEIPHDYVIIDRRSQGGREKSKVSGEIQTPDYPDVPLRSDQKTDGKTDTDTTKSYIPSTSRIDETGRIVDKIDFPFVNDPNVIGTWQSVDFVKEPVEFQPGQNQSKSGDLYLKELVVLPDGRMSKPWWTWTKGMMFHSGDKTASRYLIKEINDSTYMFFEWKSGDYVIRHQKPFWYVLKKIPSDAGRPDVPLRSGQKTDVKTDTDTTKSYIPSTSRIDETGRIVDKIDFPFVNDPNVIGTWQSVDFVKEPVEFQPGQNQSKNGKLFLKELVILPNGRMSQPWWTWTKGLIFQSDNKTASQYSFKEISGSQYMFFEWKSGDYVIRHQKPNWYVLKKISLDSGQSKDLSLSSSSQNDPVAIAIIQKLKTLYANLETYSSEGELTADIDISSIDKHQMPGLTKCQFSIKLARPLYYIEWKYTSNIGAVWSDGQKHYLLKEGKRMEADNRMMVMVSAISDSMGVAATIPGLFYNDNQANALNQMENIRQEGQESIEGDQCDVIAGGIATMTEKYWISQKTFLIRQRQMILNDQFPSLKTISQTEIIKALESAGLPTTDETIRQFKESLRQGIKGSFKEIYRNIVINHPIDFKPYLSKYADMETNQSNGVSQTGK